MLLKHIHNTVVKVIASFGGKLQTRTRGGSPAGMEPVWATKYGLQLCGLYYQGFVDNDEAVLTQHKMESVTSYGVRRSRQNSDGADPEPMADKENLPDNLDSCKKSTDKVQT